MANGRIEPVVARRCHEGLRAPVAERRMIWEPSAHRRPSGGLDHVGLDGGLVYKRQPFQGVAHEGLSASDPDVARERDIGAFLLSRLQVFFCD